MTGSPQHCNKHRHMQQQDKGVVAVFPIWWQFYLMVFILLTQSGLFPTPKQVIHICQTEGPSTNASKHNLNGGHPRCHLMLTMQLLSGADMWSIKPCQGSVPLCDFPRCAISSWGGGGGREGSGTTFIASAAIRASALRGIE